MLSGDSYLACNYRALEDAFVNCGLPGVTTAFRNRSQFDTSNVEFNGGRIASYDKIHRTPQMRHIDYGLGACNCGPFRGDCGE